MSVYEEEDQERLFLVRETKGWARSGLIAESARARCQEILKTDHRTTNVFFRLLLAGFGVLFVASSLGFVMWSFDLARGVAAGLTCLFAAAVSWLTAEHFIAHHRLWRHGLEEGFVLAALGAGLAATQFLGKAASLNHDNTERVGFFITSVFAFAAFRRFGWLYLYAGAVGLLVAGWCALDLGPVAARAASAVILLILLVWNILQDWQVDFLYRRGLHRWIQFLLVAGVAIAVNVRLDSLWIGGHLGISFFPSGLSGASYWATYAAVWLWPIVPLAAGFRLRKPGLIDGGLLALLFAIVTNKPYLQKPRYDWDPILFGLLLIALALVMMWLFRRRPGWGYRSKDVLAKDNWQLNLVSLGGAAVTPQVETPQPPTEFGGGSSGGAGAERGF